jgi:hypothetical protein
MHLELLAAPVDGIVGWEEQFGKREGRFLLEPAGSVVYLHPADQRTWSAGQSLEDFVAAVGAWNRYSEMVIDRSNREQLAEVEKLRASLRDTRVLQEREDSLWAMLLEQAEAGLI